MCYTVCWMILQMIRRRNDEELAKSSPFIYLWNFDFQREIFFLKLLNKLTKELTSNCRKYCRDNFHRNRRKYFWRNYQIWKLPTFKIFWENFQKNFQKYSRRNFQTNYKKIEQIFYGVAKEIAIFWRNWQRNFERNQQLVPQNIAKRIFKEIVR